MGLITSVNDISKVIESEKKQKQREKEQKELIRIRQIRLKRDMAKYFESKYKKSINYEKTTYFLIQNKQLIIDIIKSEYIKKYELKTLDFESNAFLNNEYMKILNNIKKPYYELTRIKENEQKETIKQYKEAEKIQKQIIKQYKEAEKMQKEMNKQQEIKNINQYKILETFIIILLLPLILVLGIIKGLLQK